MLSERLPITEVADGLPEFVDGVLLGTLTSGNRNAVWCSQWREHPDAVSRLTAMWAEWTAMLGAEDVSLHLYFRDVVDHHLPLLIDKERGTFAACDHGHRSVRRLDDAKPGTSAAHSNRPSERR